MSPARRKTPRKKAPRRASPPPKKDDGATKAESPPPTGDKKGRTFWFSSLPTLVKCAASGAQSEGTTGSGGDEAALGSAIHRVLQWRAEDPKEPGDATAAAREFQVPKADVEDHLSLLDSTAANDRLWWRPELELPEGFGIDPGDTLELSAETRIVHKAMGPAGIQVTGYGDIGMYGMDFDEESPWALFADYKTGNPEFTDPAETNLQLIAGGLAWYDQMTRKHKRAPHELHLALVFTGVPYVDAVTFREAELTRLRGTLQLLLEKADEQFEAAPERRRYRKGGHCSFCNGRATCPAWTKDLEMVTRQQWPDLQAMQANPKRTGEVYETLRVLEKAVKAAKGAVRAAAELGPMEFVADDGKDRVLEIRERHKKISLSQPFVEELAAEWFSSHPNELARFLAALDDRPMRTEPYLHLGRPRDRRR